MGTCVHACDLTTQALLINPLDVYMAASFYRYIGIFFGL
jgi:ABC-type Co2+ transport system permease subunit